MIGTLGRAVFEASAGRVFTPTGFGRSGSPRIEEHAVVGQKSQLEFIAPGLEEVSFTVRLDAALGVAPLKEIDRLRASRDAGDILPLAIGGKYLGDWMIGSLQETWRQVDNRGRLLLAEVAITLKEVKPK